VKNLSADTMEIPLRTQNCAERQESCPPEGLSFLFDNNLELRGNPVDQLHGDRRFADNFEGLIERDAALVDLETLRGE
jgi:hypothetical protein